LWGVFFLGRISGEGGVAARGRGEGKAIYLPNGSKRLAAVQEISAPTHQGQLLCQKQLCDIIVWQRLSHGNPRRLTANVYLVVDLGFTTGDAIPQFPRRNGERTLDRGGVCHPVLLRVSDP
jgi:hypothetical protein